MVQLLIGHRGTGKSSLLKRWKIYDPNAQIFDLDLEIENQQKMTVSEIFHTLGEKKFREIENQVFHRLCLHENAVIACGAGLDTSQIVPNTEVIWIRRDSDSEGRIFVDRPRLNESVSAITEFIERFQIRDSLYSKAAHCTYTLPEGLNDIDAQEKEILLGAPRMQGTMTVLKSELKGHRNYQDVVFEWRDDLLSLDEFLKIEKFLNQQQILYSVRTDQEIPTFVIQKKMKIDWDLKRPFPKDLDVHYVSTHEDQLMKALDQLRPYELSKYHLKLCPLVTDWKELEVGYNWQQTDPQRRNFLPRSTDGSWSWFRLMMKTKQKLNFFREGGLGSSLDQPTIWEWLSQPITAQNKFAAVLGTPIRHSHSPVFHKNFFSAFHIPFYKIKIDSQDWSASTAVLKNWGLSFAAVTSPLKTQAGELVNQSALNTLALDSRGNSWIGTNTDFVALEKILNPFQSSKVVIWGGGGLLETFQNLLPNAFLYSARTGLPRVGQVEEVSAPEVLIWAAGNSDILKVPEHWRPQVIIDMSYKENSPAREFAAFRSIKYQSGHELFELQAKAQQQFWKTYL